jgi:hypothetical protein
MRSRRLYTPEAGPALRYVSSAHGDVAGARHQALNFSRPPPLMGAGLELRSPLADLAGERRSLGAASLEGRRRFRKLLAAIAVDGRRAG